MTHNRYWARIFQDREMDLGYLIIHGAQKATTSFLTAAQRSRVSLEFSKKIIVHNSRHSFENIDYTTKIIGRCPLTSNLLSEDDAPVNCIHLTEGQRAQLRIEMKCSRTVQVYRRAAALLAIHEGKSVTQVAGLLGVARQSIYNWIASYGNSERNLDLRDAPRAGRPPLVTQELAELLANAFQQTPADLGYSAVNWTASLLQEHLSVRCGRHLSDETLRRHLGRLGYVWKDRQYVLRSTGAPARINTTSEAVPH